MIATNKIFLIGNGFDLAHDFKTKFSDFADYYLKEVIIPALIKCVKDRQGKHPLFKDNMLKNLVDNNFTMERTPENILRDLLRSGKSEKIKEFITSKYSILKSLLVNELVAKLYCGSSNNWFDIENTYFNELIPLKENALKKPNFPTSPELIKLNKEFSEIKLAVITYLKSVEISRNEDIQQFLQKHLRDIQYGYIINFNYTSSVRQYITDSEKIKINHIHGNLNDDNIIFGYGNDQNRHYQEMKDLGIQAFLHFFKTFDYLEDINYDKIYLEALDKYEEYEVFIVGHSLGQTDKTLISEILNSEKCKKIHLFKRGDLKDKIGLVKQDFRNLNYAASRILTDDRQLRKKIVNIKNSTFFPH